MRVLRPIKTWLYKKFEYVCVATRGDPYLEHWTLLRVGEWSIRLNHIIRADLDVEFHNHPWQWFVSWIVKGGYVESRCSSAHDRTIARIEHPRWDVNVVTREQYHHIDEVWGKGCWTIVFIGPYVGTWHFLDMQTGKTTPWRVFVKKRDGETVEALHLPLQRVGHGSEKSERARGGGEKGGACEA